ELASMRQAREGFERGLDVTRAEAQGTTSGPGGGGVLVVVRARQPLDAAQVGRGELAALAPFRQEALAGEDRPAEGFELLPRRDADDAVVLRSHRQLAREEGALLLIDADDRAVGAAFGEEPALG